MALSISQVHAKARAFLDALCKLPREQYAAIPSAHFGRDYNFLRALALEALPGIDERLLGAFVVVHPGPAGHEMCEAHFVEIETYARQILAQLTAADSCQAASPVPSPSPAVVERAPQKAYDLAAIRQEYNQAYAPWTKQDDAYLQSRFLEGATIDDLVWEFGRKPGGIRARLRKLGLEPQAAGKRSVAPPSTPSHTAEAATVMSDWRAQRPNAGRVWTQDDDQRLLREFEAGTPLETIAKALGRGVFSLEVRLCKLGQPSG